MPGLNMSFQPFEYVFILQTGQFHVIPTLSHKKHAGKPLHTGPNSAFQVLAGSAGLPVIGGWYHFRSVTVSKAKAEVKGTIIYTHPHFRSSCAAPRNFAIPCNFKTQVCVPGPETSLSEPHFRGTSITRGNIPQQWPARPQSRPCRGLARASTLLNMRELARQTRSASPTSDTICVRA